MLGDGHPISPLYGWPISIRAASARASMIARRPANRRAFWRQKHRPGCGQNACHKAFLAFPAMGATCGVAKGLQATKALSTECAASITARHEEHPRPLTPDQFITKWKTVELKERSAAQSHFIDLCRMLDEPAPTDVDPTGEWYTTPHDP